ncbi:MAG: hypothetical protein AAB706_02620 [Patescibacteria group bacterium]
MDSIVKSDIFFFVATVALVLVSLIVVIAFIYLIRILSDIYHLSHKIREEGEGMVDDVHSFRMKVKKEGKKAGDSINSFFGFKSKKKK